MVTDARRPSPVPGISMGSVMAPVPFGGRRLWEPLPGASRPPAPALRAAADRATETYGTSEAGLSAPWAAPPSPPPAATAAQHMPGGRSGRSGHPPGAVWQACSPGIPQSTQLSEEQAPCACRVAPACCKTVTLERLRARGGWGQAIQQGRGQASIWHHTRGCALGVLRAGWAMVQTPAVRPQPQRLPGDLPVLCDGLKLSGAQSGLQSLGVGPESRWASCSRPAPSGSPPGCPATHPSPPSLGRVWEGSGHEERGRTRAAGEETRRAPEVTGSRAVLEAILPGHPHPPSASQGSPSDGGREGSRRGVLPAASGPPPRRGPYGVPREPYCTQQHLLRLPHGRDPLALRLAPTPSWGPCSLGGQAWGAHPTLLGRPRLQVPRRLGRGLNLSRDATHQHKFSLVNLRSHNV